MIFGTSNGEERPVRVRYASIIDPNYLYIGAQLNLLLTEVESDGTLLPQHIVLNPDFLVDVTSICRCFTHEGDAPAMHLINKFIPSPTSAAILLGNVANQFLDDCINLHSPDVKTSLVKAFCADPLRFAAVKGIDGEFSEACKSQFNNIRKALELLQEEAGMRLDESQIETAFICEPLGIQGRMDLISGDRHDIIELKSGRGDERGRPPGAPGFHYEHAMQMALYKESLFYNNNLPYATVHTRLLYSRYPSVQEIHLGRKDIHRAMAVRNGIVHLEHLLQRQSATLLGLLTEAHFNVNGVNDRLYCEFHQPRILSFLRQTKEMAPSTHAYFHAFLGFIEREQNLSKTGVEGENMPPGYGGFADIWRTNAQQKLQAGNLIQDLRIHPIKNDEGIVGLEAELSEPTEAKFRPGDIVMLHEEADDDFNLEAQRQAASMFITCVIEEIMPNRLLLKLRYPQRDGGRGRHDMATYGTKGAEIFDEKKRYALEPTHADSSYSVLYRGLYSLLTTPESRRQLLLGERKPDFDTSRTLKIPVEDEELRDVILRATQACDYFLLVGPPGTGKTSIALRLIVTEFMSRENGESAPSLLLLAYTNRAVDEICSMLSTTPFSESYLRIGGELSCASAHRDRLLCRIAKAHPTRTAIRQLLQHTPIIVGTIASVSMQPELFMLKSFDAALVDEASQVLEPQLLPLWCATTPQGECAIGKFILIGDHKQLPAVVAQSEGETAVTDSLLSSMGLHNCRDSLFERLHRLSVIREEPYTVALLRRQGRMHRTLSQFVSEHYYNGRLTEVPLPHQLADLRWQIPQGSSRLQCLAATERIGCISVTPQACLSADTAEKGEVLRNVEASKALQLEQAKRQSRAATGPQQTGHEGGYEKSNLAEAKMTALLVECFAELCKHNKHDFQWSHRLGIIVPFRSQISQIRNELKRLNIPDYEQINIDTVERYQGSQRDIIIFSATVSTRWGLSILSSPVLTPEGPIDRKLNVAMTRAREQFFIIGNVSLLSLSLPYRELLESIPIWGAMS